jgi:CysZ protein
MILIQMGYGGPSYERTAMLASFGKALRNLTDGALLPTLLKSVGLTVLLFAVLLVAGEWALAALPALGSPLVNSALEWLLPVLAVFGLVLLGGPVAALFAGLFLDGVAARIEARDYPADPPAPGVPFWTGLKAGLGLALAVLGVDLALLPFDFALPGIGEAATLLANGWLLGREYFELVALRHVGGPEAAALRTRFSTRITLAGTLLALLAMIPLAGLIAPLFGTALMVHLFKQTRNRATA